jgi:hypothetical protein
MNSKILWLNASGCSQLIDLAASGSTLAATDMGDVPPHDPGRRLQVLISGH